MKMQKAKKYAIECGMSAALVAMAWNSVKQCLEISRHPDQSFDWKSLGIAGLKGAAWGTAAGFAFGTWRDYLNSLIVPENTDRVLDKLVTDLKLDKGSNEYVELNSKAVYVEQALMSEYRDKLHGPAKRLGSTERGTALQSRFDIDSGLNFKRDSFTSTADMRADVTEFLSSMARRGHIRGVRTQSNSIGVYFSGSNFRVDVVPVKLTSNKGHAGYLSVNKRSFFFDHLGYKKTNLKALNSVLLTKTQVKIVILLKTWRNKNGVPLKSHLLEYLVKDAYDYAESVPRTLTRKVVMVWRHIASNLDVAVIRGVENSNNVVTNIDPDDKATIIAACLKAVDRYEYQPNSILEMF